MIYHKPFFFFYNLKVEYFFFIILYPMAMGHTTHLHAEFQSELHVRKCLIDIFPPNRNETNSWLFCMSRRILIHLKKMISKEVFLFPKYIHSIGWALPRIGIDYWLDRAVALLFTFFLLDKIYIISCSFVMVVTKTKIITICLNFCR